MSGVGPLGTNVIFLSPLRLLRCQGFLSFLFIMKLSFSKPFYSTFNYASTANIQEAMKLYNLGDKSFETDFNYLHSYQSDRPVKVIHFSTMMSNQSSTWKTTTPIKLDVKSVQSALSDLLTTSATHGTFSRPSMTNLNN